MYSIDKSTLDAYQTVTLSSYRNRLKVDETKRKRHVRLNLLTNLIWCFDRVMKISNDNDKHILSHLILLTDVPIDDTESEYEPCRVKWVYKYENDRYVVLFDPNELDVHLDDPTHYFLGVHFSSVVERIIKVITFDKSVKTFYVTQDIATGRGAIEKLKWLYDRHPSDDLYKLPITIIE